MKHFQSTGSKNYLKRILTIMSGSTLGQMVPFVFIPILSQLYTPEQYYEVGLAITYATLIAMASTLRLEHALLIPESDEEVQQLTALSLRSLIIISFLGTGLLAFFYDIVFAIQTGLLALLFGFGFFMVQYVNRRKKTKSIALNKSLIGPSITFSQLIFSFHPSGLIFGKILGDFLAILPFMFSDVWDALKISINKATIKKLFETHRNFPLINLPHAFFNVLSNKAPLLVFAYLGFENLSGEFEMVTKIGLAPITVITSAFYLIFSEKFAEKARNKEKISKLFRNNVLFLLFVFGLPILFISFFAPTIIPQVLGEKWTNTGVFFQCLVPLIIATLISSPFVYTLQFFNKQLQSFKFEILSSSLKVGGLVLGLQFSPQFGLLFFSLGALIAYFSFLAYTWKLCKQFDESI